VKRSRLGNLQEIVHQPTGSDSFIRFQADNSLYIFTDTTGVTDLVRTTKYQFEDTSSWYHIVYTIDLSNPVDSNKGILWINGCRVDEWTTETQTATEAETLVGWNTANLINIGYNTNASNYNLDGYLSEVNFIDGTAYTASDFGQLKDGIWCPKAFTGTYGTNGMYYKFASGAIEKDDSGNNNDFTTFPLDEDTLFQIQSRDMSDTSTTFYDDYGRVVTAGGTVQHDTAQAKFGTSSILFDGNSDFVSVPDHADWAAIGTGDFTWEAWVRLTSASSKEALFGQGNESYTTEYIRFEKRSDGNLYTNNVQGGAEEWGAETLVTPTWSAGQWYHIAFVRDGGTTFRFFVDGIDYGQTALGNLPAGSDDWANWSGAFNIGKIAMTSPYYFDGHMDGIRFSKVARYTENFTPPTAHFGGNDYNVMIDTPTNNFPTFDPNVWIGAAPSLSAGNLIYTGDATDRKTYSTIPIPKRSKIYWEVYQTGTAQNSCTFGFEEPTGGTASDAIGQGATSKGFGLAYSSTPNNKVWGDSTAIFTDSVNETLLWDIQYTDVGQIAYDPKTGNVWVGINNTWYTEDGNVSGTADPATNTRPTYNIFAHKGVEADTSATDRMWFPSVGSAVVNNGMAINFGQGGLDSKFPALTDYTANSNGKFVYEPPTGFKAMCWKSIWNDEYVAVDEKQFDGYEDVGVTNPSGYPNDYQIGNSLVLDGVTGGDNAFLYKNLTSHGGSTNKGTYSIWFKRAGDIGTSEMDMYFLWNSIRNLL